MNPRHPERPHILFLFSDTGGGHRSAAEAIIEAVNLEFPDRFTTEMVDVYREYCPPPLDRSPEDWPKLSQQAAYGVGYKISNGRKRVGLIIDALWPFVRNGVRRMLQEHPCDIIVSVHPIPNRAIMRVMRKQKIHIPYITVITDLVTTHAFWYEPHVDMIVVPTEAARKRGLKWRVPKEKMMVLGLPVADRFCHPSGDCSSLRDKLGWPQDRPVVLMVSGGEGMGPMEASVRAVNDAKLPITLVVITGRNTTLKATLDALPWNQPTFVYGFVNEMPDFMCAADVMITKAGPGTISEALIAGTPMILYNRVEGQEVGNVDFVVSEGAGIWAPEPEQVVAALHLWLSRPEERLKAVQAAKRLARPQAARQIANLVAARVGVSKGHANI
jgi:1,2-diacylglycerol 3-beta-galactosyltransferase